MHIYWSSDLILVVGHQWLWIRMSFLILVIVNSNEVSYTGDYELQLADELWIVQNQVFKEETSLIR